MKVTLLLAFVIIIVLNTIVVNDSLAVFVQEPAGLFQLLIEQLDSVGICQAQVTCQQDIITTLFKASLGNVEETKFVCFT